MSDILKWWITKMSDKKYYHYGALKEPKEFFCGCRQAYSSSSTGHGAPELFLIPCCTHTTMRCVNKDCVICLDKQDNLKGTNPIGIVFKEEPL